MLIEYQLTNGSHASGSSVTYIRVFPYLHNVGNADIFVVL